MNGKTIIILAIIACTSFCIAHIITLHNDFLRWCTRPSNPWGVPAYLGAVVVLLTALGWLV